jgi:hypothetical protein
MAKTDRAEKAYQFLQERSRDQVEFGYDEIVVSTGWARGTASSYASKHWKDILDRVRSGRFRAKLDFQRITLERFLLLSTQKKTIFSRYSRQRFEQHVHYEFLLPLSREGELRRALDELFYLDTVCHRLREIGLSKLTSWLNKEKDEAEDAFILRVAELIGDRFGGYSIGHVTGRFRKADLLTRADAARRLEQNHDYLIDETTASVRFIVPVLESLREYEGGFGSIHSERAEWSTPEIEEINLIHEMFFELFAEAAVRTVGGEDQIWLVEESLAGRYRYVWKAPS